MQLRSRFPAWCTLLCAGTFFSACEGAETLDPSVGHIATALSLHATPDTLLPGDTATITVRVTNRYGTRLAELRRGERIEWSVSRPERATLLPGSGTGPARLIMRDTGSVEVAAKLNDLHAGAEVAADLPPRLEVDQRETVLHAFGDSARLTARVRGVPIAITAAWVVAEHRWLAEEQVVTPTLLPGRFVARGPGTALLHVEAPRTRPDTVLVRVAPSRPIVYGAAPAGPLRPGDTLQIRGYRADAITGLRLGGAPLAVARADSARAWAVVPAYDEPGCGGSARAALTAEGADIRGGILLFRERQGEFRLAPTEARRVGATDLECLRLPIRGSSVYHLVYFDPRPMEFAALTGSQRVGVPAPTGVIDVEVIDRSGTAAATAGPAPRPARGATTSTSPAEPPAAAAGAEALSERETPWTVGEHFQAEAHSVWGSAFTVVAIHGNLVWAAPSDDTTAYLPLVQLHVEQYSRWAIEQAWPRWRDLYGDLDPVTSPGSGQVLILFSPRGPVLSTDSENGHIVFSRYTFNTATLAWGTNFLALFQQFARLWNRRANEARVDRGDPLPLLSSWQTSGIAAFLANEELRRRAGDPPLGNVEGQRIDSVRAWRTEWQAAGTPQAGGVHVAAIFREFAARLVRDRGYSWDAAAQEILRGAMNNWWGCTWLHCQLEGVGDVMRRAHGSAWDPVDAMLLYAASQAMDDLTPSPVFQNRTFELVGVRAFNSSATWTRTGLAADALLRSGFGDPGRWRPPAGAVGYFTIQDNDVGGTFSAAASEPAVQWLIVRQK
jgi:hypothetical protein